MRKLFTYHSPLIKKATTTIFGKAASTASLGGALGRLVPGLGAVITTLDIWKLSFEMGQQYGPSTWFDKYYTQPEHECVLCPK